MLNTSRFSFLTIILLFSGSSLVFSQDNSTFNFLKVDPSARASALAGAFETYTDDPNTIFYNPAGLSTITNKKVSAGFGKYLLDINFGALSYAQKYKDIGWFGASIKYFNYGTFDYADENGNVSGTFNANDIMFSIGYSNYIYEIVNYGVSIKYIYSKIAEYNSSALAFDFGLLYLIPSEQINIALSVNNLGSQIDAYNDTKEKLPLDIRVGVSKKLEHLPLRLSVSLYNLNVNKDKFIQRFKSFSIGGEFSFSENVAVRIGYNNEKRQDLKLGSSLGIAGFSAGLGIKFMERYQFDYSLNSFGKVGSTHRFNLGYTFD
ncbi:MAG: type IX secretion system protein PorQ [Ignavibacteria bacterium]